MFEKRRGVYDALRARVLVCVRPRCVVVVVSYLSLGETKRRGFVPQELEGTGEDQIGKEHFKD